jgi:hypothetical protein
MEPLMKLSHRNLLLAATLCVTLTSLAPTAQAATRAFVFQTDYTTGSLSSVDVTPRTKHCDIASVHSDARLRYYNGKLYVVNRFGADNIQVVDPATGNTTLQFSVGNGSNPYDIAFASPTKAYVTRYESSDLWIVNPQSGVHTGTIALGAFADADGIPEMDHMITVGPLLFISLQRVDRAHGFVATDTSLVAVVDTRTDALVDCDAARPGIQAIRLQLTNPVTAFQFDAATSRLAIGCVGDYSALDGGIEWIDPVTLKSAGIAMRESQLHGDVNAISLAPGRTGAAHAFAVVSDVAFNTLLLRVDLTHAAITDTLYAPGGFAIGDIAENDAGELWVCDNGFGTSGVRMFNAVSGQPLAGPLACTLPPVALTFDSASGSVGDVPSATPTLAFAPPAPSPARTSARFTLTMPQSGSARLEAFDATGRRVRTLFAGELPAGERSVTWDLAGLAPGVYLVRAQVGSQSLTHRLLVVR